MRGEGGKALFTSDLSVSEFVLLKQLKMEPLGLVLGSSIYHVGLQVGKLFTNEELPYLSNAMYQARALAMSRMEEEADVLGADGVLGVHLQVGRYAWSGEALEFTAVGTAVKAPPGERLRTNSNRPFTSFFSVQDFYKTYRAGYLPSALVMGNCVYHVAHQNVFQSLAQTGKNIELQNFTQAIYDARELAMSRMQAEAEDHEADGIIGVEVVEKNHNWQPHIIEFFATGTSVVSRKTSTVEESIPEPIFALGLND